MSKAEIATILYRMKRAGQTLITVGSELFSADELLTAFYGREVDEAEAQSLIQPHAV